MCRIGCACAKGHLGEFAGACDEDAESMGVEVVVALVKGLMGV